MDLLWNFCGFSTKLYLQPPAVYCQSLQWEHFAIIFNTTHSSIDAKYNRSKIKGQLFVQLTVNEERARSCRIVGILRLNTDTLQPNAHYVMFLKQRSAGVDVPIWVGGGGEPIYVGGDAPILVGGG